MYPHRIRLRGPWELYVCDGPMARVTVPGRLADWGVARGPVRLARNFGLPRRIDPFERVWLTAAGFGDRAAFTLNDEPLGEAAGAFERELTTPLRDRNRLTLDLTAGDGTGGLWGKLALEVRRTAYLRGVRRDGATVTGEVAGWSDEPLELYVDADGRHLHYAAIGEIAVPKSWSFAVPADASEVRVQLIGGAVVWWEGVA